MRSAVVASTTRTCAPSLRRPLSAWRFIGNSFVIERLPGFDTNVVGFSAVTGALILGFPMIWVAIKDMRAGLFNTNLLVALAVLALFGSGHYQEAGIVSFFMQLGQIIETRTAEGALASIHSLIKLTPTKARRVNGSEEQEVAVHELAVGDMIRVRPGRQCGCRWCYCERVWFV